MTDQTLTDILRRLNTLERTSALVRVGEVTGTGPLDVALGGASTSYDGVKALAPVVVGDQVAALLWANDLIVLGTIGDGDIHKAALPLGTNWGNFGGAYENATYSRLGRLVRLQGLVTKTGTPAGADVIATLPAGYRPTGRLMFEVSTGSANARGVVEVTSAGDVLWIAGATGETDFTSLSNIVFVVD